MVFANTCRASGAGAFVRGILTEFFLFADETAFLLVVLEVHGSDIQPFGYDDRVDFLVALDDAIVHINLSNIELLAVEEFLPAAGPAAESLLNLYGTNGVMGKPPPKPQAEAPSGNAAAQTLSANPRSPPQTRAAGRKLLQIPARGTYSGAGTPMPCPPLSICAPSCRSCTVSQLPGIWICLHCLLRCVRPVMHSLCRSVH